MKKIFLISITLLAGLFILTGCSSQNANNLKSQAGGPGVSTPGGRRMPDFGQPQRQADIRGVVKSITGNAVTILKIDMAARRNNNATSTETTGDSTRSATALSLGGRTGGGAGGARGGFGGFGGPGGGGQGSTGGTATDRAATIANLKAISTGEETVTIPVGIRMLKSQVNSTTGKREMIEASLTDITADKTITIWLKTNTATTNATTTNATTTNATSTNATSVNIAEFVLIN